MAVLEKIQFNISKLIAEQIFLTERDYEEYTQSELDTLKYIEEVLGRDTFVQLCEKIMEENS